MKYIVDIHGEIEGDYEIIGKYEERPQGYEEAIKAIEISAKKAQEAIEVFKQGLDKAEEQAKQKLKEIPTGKWEYKTITDDYRVYGRCSNCLQRKRIDNFCPNCGAKMDGGADDE